MTQHTTKAKRENLGNGKLETMTPGAQDLEGVVTVDQGTRTGQ